MNGRAVRGSAEVPKGYVTAEMSSNQAGGERFGRTRRPEWFRSRGTVGNAKTAGAAPDSATVPGDEVRDMVEHAYDRVVASLPKAQRTRLSR